jgi:hypothetical protein
VNVKIYSNSLARLSLRGNSQAQAFFAQSDFMSLASADFFPAAPSFRPREDACADRRRVPDLLAGASRLGAGMSKTAPRAPAVEIAFLAK